jgi:hypothetical protein
MTKIETLSVNINEATADELIKIRGIGDSLAQSIIDLRPFGKLSELVSVPGINQVKLASLLPYLTLDEPQEEAPKMRTSASKSDDLREPISDLGDTQTFLFLEGQKEREDALLIIFGGFIIGLIMLLIRRRSR